jgi:predicted nuclease of predicted toxin-antitoxin system
VKFLVDRCAGRRLAQWLRTQGHDVREATEVNPDPGDQALLRWAMHEGRVLITIDSDFGLLVFHNGEPHSGIVRLPDVPADQRIVLVVAQLIERYETDLHQGAILTVGTKRVHVSRTLPNPP